MQLADLSLRSVVIQPMLLLLLTALSSSGLRQRLIPGTQLTREVLFGGGRGALSASLCSVWIVNACSTSEATSKAKPLSCQRLWITLELDLSSSFLVSSFSRPTSYGK